MYEVETCPMCRSLMWNGYCEDKDCQYHWHPKLDDTNEDEDEDED